MIRDPRAIFSSMEKNYRKSPELDKGMVNHAEMNGVTTEQRIDQWAAGVPVGMAFQRLYQIVKENNDKKMLFIKYEKLMEDPKKEMKRLYEYLGVDYFEHDFNNIEQITKEDDSVYGVYGDHVIKPKLTVVKPDWNDVLGKNASVWIKTNYSWFYDYFGYI
jgi:sulfotransferase